MAYTRIHPIKSTLNLAINYICNDKKTDDNIYISCHNCHYKTAHLSFLNTREINKTKGTILAHHIIQSFDPGETDAETAHKIGMDLCKKLLKNEHEFVMTTHVDKDHIHNHIIFNNVNHVTGRCYQSNIKNYHKLRDYSDKLCRENDLSVIDEYYEIYKKKYKNRSKSWYEYQHHKKGTSWKSKLQFDIDRAIKIAKDWDDFLSLMQKYGYEIKHGKHIAFKHKDKERFTRSKTIGEDYTEEKIKERINNNQKEFTNLNQNYKHNKKEKRIIDIKHNAKAQQSKGYYIWAKKHNLKVGSDTLIEMQKYGYITINQLNKGLNEETKKLLEIQDALKHLDKEIEIIEQNIEDLHTLNKYKSYFEYYQNNPDDKLFYLEYKKEIAIYERTLKSIKNRNNNQIPDSKSLIKKLEKIHNQRENLMKTYKQQKEKIDDLYDIRERYNKYFSDKEMNKNKEI